MTKISLTPVIDVVFILLIFFMLASNFNKVGEINMDMTKESTTSSKEDIKIIKLSKDVYLTLYYLTGSYKYSNGKANKDYKTRASNIWLYEDGGFKLYYKNFTNLKKELEPTDIIAYPMD